MADVRKSLLALTVLGLAAAATASAQSCQTLVPATTAGGQGYVGVEGTTELLPGIQINCDGGSVYGVSVTITANVPFTNVQSDTAIAFATNSNSVGSAATTPATITLGGTPNTLTASVDFNPSGTLYYFNFSGLRVNASLAPSGQPVTITAQITATTGPSSFVHSGIAATPVAFVSPSNLTPVVVGAANVSACAPNLGNTFPVATVTITEAFPSAFKSPGDIQGGTSTQKITEGMHIAVTFNNLVNGVFYQVPNPVAGTGSLSLAAVVAAGTVTGPGYVLLIPSKGSATIIYEVTKENPALIESATFALTETPEGATVWSQSTNQLTGTKIDLAPSPVTVSVSLASAPAGNVYPQYSAAAPVLTGTQAIVPGSNGLLLTCETVLEYPFVTNASGFETGIDISNSSPFSGTCALNFHQSGVNGATNPASVTAPNPNEGTNQPYLPGETYTFQLTQALGVNANNPATFQGYVIAECDFPGAQGFAYVLGGLQPGMFVNANNTATGYIATVINNNGVPGNQGF